MRTALIYLIFGVIWILFSDAIGLHLSQDPKYITTFQNYKGIFFVGLSALLILLLEKAEARRRVKTGQALSESENLFRATFDLAGIGMAHVSPQGNWLRVNGKLCEILGYSSGELLSGMTFQQVTHADDLRADIALAQQLLDDKIDSYQMEKRYLRKEGSSIWVHITVSLVRHENGTPRYFISAVEDISERRKTSEELANLTATLDHRVWQRTNQLAEANRDMESFSYSVSHDLRAPIRAIIGFAQIIQRRYNSAFDEQGQHYLGNIILAAERMNRLVDDLLRYSRLGRQSVRLQTVTLDGILKTVIEDLSDEIVKTGARIEITTPLPIVRGDATLLGQIFLNLLDNALKYRRPDVRPEIIISSMSDTSIESPQEPMCLVQISDNGQGIPTEQHEKVFNVFQRLHSDETYPGTGIGLAIVSKSASLLGGSVKLESVSNTSENCGCIFTVQLPLAVSGNEF